jgi:hypothetical protein
MQPRIKATKIDQFRATATITIGSNSGIYCPVRALQTYLPRASTDYAGPLFCYSNGVPLSRSQFTKELYEHFWPKVVITLLTICRPQL